MLNLFSLWGRKAPAAKGFKNVDPLEDVQRLYDQLNLDSKAYHRFEPTPLPAIQIRPTPAEPVPLDAPPEPVTPVASSASVAPAEIPVKINSEDASTSASTLAPAEPTENLRSTALPTPSRSTESRTQRFSLLSLFERDVVHGASADAPVVGFASFSGGVGKSTLSASLAICMLARGQRCMILGQTIFSPLPYYLGGSGLDLDNEPGPVLHYKQPIPPIGKSLNVFIGEGRIKDIIEEARQVVSRADLILLDLEASPLVTEEFEAIDLLIVPIRPDINALIIIDRIEQSVARMPAPPKMGVFYILNQHDQGNELHTAIKQTLETRLENRLISIAMPLDNSVQQALANGEAPQFYQPDSPFAESLETLSNWLEKITVLPKRILKRNI